MSSPVAARGALASIRYILVLFAVLFVAATALCGWLLVTSHDPMFVVFGTASVIGLVGTCGAVRAARLGLDGLAMGAAGAPQVVRARGLARTATRGLLLGAVVPVLVAGVIVAIFHANVTLAILSVMGALALGMWSMVVDSCRKLLDRASAPR